MYKGGVEKPTTQWVKHGRNMAELRHLARITTRSVKTFGNHAKAAQWLIRPTKVLDGKAPVELLDSPAGAAKVEDLLIRIDHGIAT